MELDHAVRDVLLGLFMHAPAVIAASGAFIVALNNSRKLGRVAKRRRRGLVGDRRRADDRRQIASSPRRKRPKRRRPATGEGG